MQSDDPTVIRVLAVHTDDVVSALEANVAWDVRAVLRVTPPFTGRMRARLHIEGAEGAYDTDPEPLHVGPERLVDDDTPPYSTPDRTEDELRSASGDRYTPEEHHDFHARRPARCAWLRSGDSDGPRRGSRPRLCRLSVPKRTVFRLRLGSGDTVSECAIKR